MREDRINITLEELIRRVGPRRLLWSIARICDQIARTEDQAQWPMWLSAADLLIECSAIMPEVGEIGSPPTALQ